MLTEQGVANITSSVEVTRKWFQRRLIWPLDGVLCFILANCCILQVKGFSECMQALRPGLDAVHDVAIAYHNYKDGGPPSEKTLLAGEYPPPTLSYVCIHLHRADDS